MLLWEKSSLFIQKTHIPEKRQHYSHNYSLQITHPVLAASGAFPIPGAVENQLGSLQREGKGHYKQPCDIQPD